MKTGGVRLFLELGDYCYQILTGPVYLINYNEIKYYESESSSAQQIASFIAKSSDWKTEFPDQAEPSQEKSAS